MKYITVVAVTSPAGDRISKFFAKHTFVYYDEYNEGVSLEIYIFKLCLFVDFFMDKSVKINVVYNPG